MAHLWFINFNQNFFCLPVFQLKLPTHTKNLHGKLPDSFLICVSYFGNFELKVFGLCLDLNKKKSFRGYCSFKKTFIIVNKQKITELLKVVFVIF